MQREGSLYSGHIFLKQVVTTTPDRLMFQNMAPNVPKHSKDEEPGKWSLGLHSEGRKTEAHVFFSENKARHIFGFTLSKKFGKSFLQSQHLA